MRAVQVFPRFRPDHLHRETGLMFHHLSRFTSTAEILTLRNAKRYTAKGFHPKLTFLRRPFLLRALWDLITTPRDILVLYHSHPFNPLYILSFKIRNPKGVAIVKADMDESILTLKRITPLNIARRIKIWWNLLSTDIFIVEQARIYRFLRNRYGRFKKKIRNLPTGYGDLQIPRLKQFSQKENIILVVGNLGEGQKATDTVLKVAAHLKWSSWKMILVGQIDPSFKQTVQEFYEKHPTLRKKVVFHGRTKNRKEMLDLYNRAKILFMPSRWEGFANVPVEAAFYSNVIIGTPVGGVKELTDNGKIGALCPIDNVSKLKSALQKRMDSPKLLETESIASKNHCDANYRWEAITEQIWNTINR